MALILIKPKQSILAQLRSYLIKGLLILIPVGTTLLVCIKLYDWLHALVLVHIHSIFHLLGLPTIPFLDLITLLVLLVTIGFVGGNFLGRSLFRLINMGISHLPMVRVVYSAIQQILEAILTNDKKAFRQVVLVEYPRIGMYSMGFISNEPTGSIRNAVGEDCYTVFIPTTPNPTSGMMVFVPKHQVKILDMSINDGAKLVMSGGVVGEPMLKVDSTTFSNHQK